MEIQATVDFTSPRTAVKSCVRAWSEREGVSATQRHGNSTYSLEESFPWVCVVHSCQVWESDNRDISTACATTPLLTTPVNISLTQLSEWNIMRKTMFSVHTKHATWLPHLRFPRGCHTLAARSKFVVGVANMNVADEVSTRKIQSLSSK